MQRNSIKECILLYNLQVFFILFYGSAFSCHKYETKDSLIKCYASRLQLGAAPYLRRFRQFFKEQKHLSKISSVLNDNPRQKSAVTFLQGAESDICHHHSNDGFLNLIGLKAFNSFLEQSKAFHGFMFNHSNRLMFLQQTTYLGSRKN